MFHMHRWIGWNVTWASFSKHCIYGSWQLCVPAKTLVVVPNAGCADCLAVEKQFACVAFRK